MAGRTPAIALVVLMAVATSWLLRPPPAPVDAASPELRLPRRVKKSVWGQTTLNGHRCSRPTGPRGRALLIQARWGPDRAQGPPARPDEPERPGL